MISHFIRLSYYFVPRFVAQCDALSIASHDVNEWEKDKQACSFCKFYLNSPCRLQFRDWSRCIERAKLADDSYVEVCHHFSNALFDCTREYKSFFQDEEP